MINLTRKRINCESNHGEKKLRISGETEQLIENYPLEVTDRQRVFELIDIIVVWIECETISESQANQWKRIFNLVLHHNATRKT